jgi:NAD(P)-dependent dehydrogenase (short-subunit alcohol dehydrogenase family)
MKKTVLVTGSTDGIGKQTALELAKRGFHVIVHGRKEAKCVRTRDEILYNVNNAELDYVVADFASFDSVRILFEEIKMKYDKLDVLVNNAGVFMNERVITADGFEATFQINHLSPFLLTNLLFPLIEKSDDGRIVNVSSIAHKWAKLDFDNLNGEKGYDGQNAYSISKLANILFTYKLHRMTKGKPAVNALHPGVIGTKLLYAGWGMGGDSLENGAKTSVYLASSEEVKGVSGKYFVNMKEEKSSPITYDENLQDEFWQYCVKSVNL